MQIQTQCAPQGRRFFSAVAAWLLVPDRVRVGLGLIAGAVLFVGLSMPWPARAVALGAKPVDWVADRDADEVVGLDVDHFVLARLTVRSPVRLATAPGGVWVAASVEGNPIGRHALKRVGDDGRLRDVPGGSDLGPVLDLEVAPSGRALVVEMGLAGKPSRVLMAGGGGAPASAGPVAGVGTFELVQHAGALAVMGELAAGGGAVQERVLIGDEAGRVGRYDLAGNKLAEVVLGGQIGDLAAGPDGKVLALDITGAGRILCLNAGLELVWSVPAGLICESLSVVLGEERVWLVDSTEPLARRFGPTGVLEVEVLLPSSDASGIQALSGGGALITVPGAVLHVDSSGALLPGQGGFDYLTDITPAG